MGTQKNKRKSRKKTKSKSPDIKHFLINKLRRASYMWPCRKEALALSRIDRGKYKCAMCDGIKGPKEIKLDHIKPVVDPEVGFTTWDVYINRLFCSVEGYQTLCSVCHDTKTSIENEIRKQVKRKINRSGDGEDI